MHKTYYSIEKMNAKMFKKIGYLLIASIEQNKEYYKYLVNCMMKFQLDIEQKINTVQNSDVKQDLINLKIQHSKLYTFVLAKIKPLFDTIMNKNIKQYSSYKTLTLGKTNFHIEKWRHKLFQKLGWMIFAIEYNNILKL